MVELGDVGRVYYDDIARLGVGLEILPPGPVIVLGVFLVVKVLLGRVGRASNHQGQTTGEDQRPLLLDGRQPHGQDQIKGGAGQNQMTDVHIGWSDVGEEID